MKTGRKPAEYQRLVTDVPAATAGRAFGHEERVVVLSKERTMTSEAHSAGDFHNEDRASFSTTLYPDPVDKNWIQYLEVCRERFAERLLRPVLALPSPYKVNENLKIIDVLPSTTHWEQFTAWDTTQECLQTLRVARKRNISNKLRTKFLVNEKHLMFCCEFPFILDSSKHWQTPRSLFMLSEHLPGKNLLQLAKESGKIPIEQAKFYGAQIVLVLEYLHATGVILRELKIEHVYIGKDGYVKLADLANATTAAAHLISWIDDFTPGSKTSSNLGCRPPEVWLQQPYGVDVDWWLLGLFLYKMYTGNETFPEEPPSQFYEEHMRRKIFDLHYDTPRWFNAVDKKLFKQLFVLDSNGRLGAAGEGGVTAVKNHPWFKGVSWIGLYAGLEKAPWIPASAHPEQDPGTEFMQFAEDEDQTSKIKNPLPFGHQFQNY